MRIVNIGWVLLALTFFSAGALSSSHNDGAKGQKGQPLDSRIEQFVQKTCGDDAACIEKKRTEYIERMANYKLHVQETCGDDKACRQEMKAKYMKRRANREERIAQHCGDDEVCRDELREKYSLKMKDARKQCGDKKACWKKFYEDNKPKGN